MNALRLELKQHLGQAIGAHASKDRLRTWKRTALSCIILAAASACSIVHASLTEATGATHLGQDAGGSALREWRAASVGGATGSIEPSQAHVLTQPYPTQVEVTSSSVILSARGGLFVVQVGAYSSEEAAKSRWIELTQQAPDIFRDAYGFIERAEGGSTGAVYRVRFGYFREATDAQGFCALLNFLGDDCLVLRTARSLRTERGEAAP